MSSEPPGGVALKIGDVKKVEPVAATGTPPAPMNPGKQEFTDGTAAPGVHENVDAAPSIETPAQKVLPKSFTRRT